MARIVSCWLVNRMAACKPPFENMQAAQVPQEQEMTSRSRTLSFRILMQPKSLSGSFKLIGTNHHESLIYHTDTWRVFWWYGWSSHYNCRTEPKLWVAFQPCCCMASTKEGSEGCFLLNCRLNRPSPLHQPVIAANKFLRTVMTNFAIENDGLDHGRAGRPCAN